MLRGILTTLSLVLLGISGYAGYRLLHSGLETAVYRARLEELSGDYQQLRDQYNEAIQKTAVTELLVRDGRIDIAIRTADGERRIYETPFDPNEEIYVDFVVVEGRLWIRRLFDEKTPPGQGMTIDPHFVDVDWAGADALHGKAVYRSFDEGRWIVTVTGSGALGLVRMSDDIEAELQAAPELREYAPVEESVEGSLDGIGPGEIIETLARELDLATSDTSQPAQR